jgi:hypothetical protein
MKNKKIIKNASVFAEYEIVAEKLLIVDAFEAAMRSKPARISFDQHLIEGHLLHQK